MRLTHVTLAILVVGMSNVLPSSADPDRRQARRESRLEPKEIDDAIADAERAAEAWHEALDEELAETKQDRKKREAEIRKEVKELVDALARLRKGFDDDVAWADQRAEARVAVSTWHSLDPVLRKHWASDARDEFEVLHRELRRLARIYEIDPPRR